jgi:polyisoprenoid-binding protein YceI
LPRVTHRDGVDVRVFVMREGIAAAVGHDVELQAGDVEAEIAPDRVVATVGTASLKVVGAVKDGVTDPSGFSRLDRALIEKSTRGDVLDAAKFPVARFASTSVVVDGDRARIAGDLTVRGTTRSVAFDAARAGARWTAELVVDQPAFGIAPFTAFFGALKVKPHVVVRVSVPAPRDAP